MTTTDLHRIYIQSLLARRVMTQTIALQLYGRAVEICQSKSCPFLQQKAYDKSLILEEVHKDFKIPYPVTDKGLTEFLSDITTLLEEARMSVVTGREETGAGRIWIALVSYRLLEIGTKLMIR